MKTNSWMCHPWLGRSWLWDRVTMVSEGWSWLILRALPRFALGLLRKLDICWVNLSWAAVHGIQRIHQPTRWVQAAGCEQHVSHPSPRSSNTLQCRREGDGMGPWAMEAEGPWLKFWRWKFECPLGNVGSGPCQPILEAKIKCPSSNAVNCQKVAEEVRTAWRHAFGCVHDTFCSESHRESSSRIEYKAQVSASSLSLLK